MTELALERFGSDERVLLHELNHRINNEFAAAINLVSLAATRSCDENVKAALSGVRELLHHYADVHHALQMPENDMPIDATVYLHRLCLSISRSKLDHREIRLVLSVQLLPLQAQRCWRLGMIVNELITNAARHAFAAGSGEIRVTVCRDGEFVKCSVKDNGSAASNIRLGQGLRIAERLSSALGGRIEQKFGPCGSAAALIFPYDGGPGRLPV